MSLTGPVIEFIKKVTSARSPGGSPFIRGVQPFHVRAFFLPNFRAGGGSRRFYNRVAQAPLSEEPEIYSQPNRPFGGASSRGGNVRVFPCCSPNLGSGRAGEAPYFGSAPFFPPVPAVCGGDFGQNARGSFLGPDFSQREQEVIKIFFVPQNRFTRAVFRGGSRKFHVSARQFSHSPYHVDPS